MNNKVKIGILQAVAGQGNKEITSIRVAGFGDLKGEELEKFNAEWRNKLAAALGQATTASDVKSNEQAL